MITGKVVDAKGEPVVDAKITIEQTDGVTRKFETKSDKKGEFIQIGLQSASFKVTAVAKDGSGDGANTRVSQRGPSPVRLVIGGGAGNDPGLAAKTAELRKAFDDGVALSRAGKYDESVESFNKAIAINPKCQDCFYNIGFAYAQKKEYDKAEENYKKALEVKPDYAEAYNGLANIYNAQRKFDLAAEASKKASELSAAAPGALAGGNADALFNQGVILWNGGKIADAKKQFEAAIAANPNHAEAHYQLGMALVNEGKLKEAGDEFNAYLKMAPGGPERRDSKGSGRAASEVVPSGPPVMPAVLRARLADVRDRIARAAARAGRDPSHITLLAVSKTFGADAVRAPPRPKARSISARTKSRKRSSNARRRATCHSSGTSSATCSRTRRRRRPPNSTSSTRSTARILVRKLDAAATAPPGGTITLLAQADLAGEATKHGAREDELPSIFQAAAGCAAIKMSGLMIIPPAGDDPEQARPWFRKLREVRDRLIAQGIDRQLTELSMGMSHDYEIAIEEGATMVRVGTAIFGAR